MWCEIRNHYQVYFFILVSLTSLLLQYQAGNFKLIIFHDSPYPIDALSLIYKFTSVWRDVANFGYFDPSGTFLSLFYIFLYAIQFITNNLIITQFLFLLIICNLALNSSYYLARYIGINKIFSIMTGILYLANPYSIFYTWRILNANIILYAMLPLMILSIIKIVRNEQSKRYIFILLFGEFLSFPGFANMAYYISFVFVALAFSLSYSFIIRRSSSHITTKNKFLKNIIVLILLILPISGYLFSILEVQPKEFSVDRSIAIQGAESIYKSNTDHITLASLFSLTGFPPLYEKLIWFDYQYIYFQNISNIISLVVASVIFIVLAILSLEGKNRINKNIYPFIIILVVLCIPLLKETGQMILHYFPLLLLAFRDPFHKFASGFALVLIILFSYCAQELFKTTNMVKQYKFLRVSLILVILFPVVYWVAPFVSGHFVPTDVGKPEGHMQTISAFTDKPYKYMPAINYLKQDSDVASGKVRVLVYPLTGVLWCDNGYYGNDILRFSGISTISTNSHVNSKNESIFITKLFDIGLLKDPGYVNFIAKLGIKYILIRKLACEVDTGTGNIHDLSDILKNIREQINKMPIRKVMENADYSLFELTGNERPGYISLVRAVFPLENESTTIKKINFFNTTSNYNNLFSQQQQFQPDYQKISSSEYKIKIENITKPFYIMFAVSYDQGWKAFINGEQIPDKYHLIVDDFANGWYVNSNKNNNEHEFVIKLYYEPQKYYELGLIVYAIIICICLILLFPSESRKIRYFIKGLIKERKLLKGKSSIE